MVYEDITQSMLNRECKYGFLYSNGAIGCSNKKAGHTSPSSVLGFHLCLASNLCYPSSEYASLDVSNCISAMNSCAYKIPLIVDEERYKQRLEAKDLVYNRASKMLDYIDNRTTKKIVIGTNDDLEAALSLIILSYLDSKYYNSTKSVKKFNLRKDVIREINSITEKISNDLEARM